MTSYSELDEAASSDDEPRIIIVEGTISDGTEKIRVGANKSIIGKDSNAGMSLLPSASDDAR